MRRVHLSATTWRLAWCIFFMNSAPSVTRAKVRSPSANVSISSVLVKRPYFLRLLSVPSLFPHPSPSYPRPERLAEGSEVKIKRLSSLPLREERSAVTIRPRFAFVTKPDELPKHFDLDLLLVVKPRLCKMRNVRLVRGRSLRCF